METYVLYALGAIGALVLWRRALMRIRLSRAKHPSLAGHGKLARRCRQSRAALLLGADRFFRADSARIPAASGRSTSAGADLAMCAHYTIAGAHDDGGIPSDRPRSFLELSGEALVQAPETSLLRFV